MAKECSFDIVSEFDKQELMNAVDQTQREISTRFDLKDSNSSVVLDADKSITITTNDDKIAHNRRDCRTYQKSNRSSDCFFGMTCFYSTDH